MYTFQEAVAWWHESLEAAASTRTRKLYRDASDGLLAWLESVGHLPADYPDRRVLDRYFTAFRSRPNRRTGKPLSGSYVQQHWRSLQQLYKFLEAEELVDRNPFTAGMAKPSIPESPVPIFTDDDLRGFMTVTEGKDARQRRDRAIIRVLLDTGVRVGELCGLQLDDVDFSQRLVLVTGKGSHSRTVPFNAKSGTELRRWLMVRPRILSTALFTDLRGRGNGLTTSGVRQILSFRAEQAGISNPHPHRFRHTAAHLWMANGGPEIDLERIMGWRSSQMVKRYGASAGAERAQATARRLAIADRY